MKNGEKHKAWKDIYNWDTCKLDRAEFGKFIANYLTASEKLVANLDAPWGSGKTEFLKRIYVELAERNHPVIYIDAWESDFSNNPLSVVSSEFVEQITSIKGKRVGNALSELKVLLNKALKIITPAAKAYSFVNGESEWANHIASMQSISDSLPELGCETLEETNTNLLDSLKDAHFAQIKAMRKIKEKLSFIAELLESIHNRNLPVVVLIDELDRCRPPYAVELLEVVKHFFEIKGYVFVFASDTNQLHSSIKTIYGQEFESETYLKRFFERKIRLPEPSISSYIRSKNIRFYTESSKLFLHPFDGENKLSNTFFENFLDLVKKHRISAITLRDVDQILAKLNAILSHLEALQEEIHLNLVCLVLSLIDEQMGLPYWIEKGGTYLGSDIELLGMNLNDFVLLHRGFMFEKESKRIYEIGVDSYTDYARVRKCLMAESRKMSVKQSERIFSIAKSSEKIVTAYHCNYSKYLLLDDIIKLIELSDSIQ